MTLNRPWTFKRCTYFQKAPLNWKQSKMEQVQSVILKSNYHSRSILQFSPRELFKPQGWIHVFQATIAIRAVWKIRSDSGLTGLIIPLLIMWLLKLKIPFASTWFCRRLNENLSYSFSAIKKHNFVFPSGYLCTFPSVEKYFPLVSFFPAKLYFHNSLYEAKPLES